MARLGGDEFGMILSQVVSRAGGRAGRRAAPHARSRRELELPGRRVCVTASVGVVFLDEHIAG